MEKKKIIIIVVCLCVVGLIAFALLGFQDKYSPEDYYSGSEFVKLEKIVKDVNDSNITPRSGCTAGYTFLPGEKAIEKLEEYRVYLDKNFESDYDSDTDTWYYMDSKGHEMVIGARSSDGGIMVIINPSMCKAHEDLIERQSNN